MITESKLYNIGSQSGTKLNGTKLSYMDYFIPNFIKMKMMKISNVYIYQLKMLNFSIPFI